MIYTRNKTKKVKVGNIVIGGNNNIVIQSMTNTKTSNIRQTVNQIKWLFQLGCQLVRVSVLDIQDAESLAKIVKLSPCPIVADIHFNVNFALKAISAKVAKIRINPGNLKDLQEFKKIILEANKNKVAIRIGINSGSLPENIKTNSQIINLIKKYISVCEKHKFSNIVLSVKSTSVQQTIELNKLLAKNFKYPLHIGVTEAGDLQTSCIRSTIVLTELLKLGIGNTIRISISGDPYDEPIVAKTILQENGFSANLTKLISCPTCGRMQVNSTKLLHVIKPYIDLKPKKITVAIMGCLVNGLNEAKNADIGIYGLKNKFVIYANHKKIGTFDFTHTLKTFKSIYDAM